MRDPLNPGDVVRYNAKYFDKIWRWYKVGSMLVEPTDYWLSKEEAARHALMVVEAEHQMRDVYECRNLLTNETLPVHREWLERIKAG
jgi:hypothetical protein